MNLEEELKRRLDELNKNGQEQFKRHKKKLEEQLARQAEQLQQRFRRFEEELKKSASQAFSGGGKLNQDQERIIAAALVLLNEVGLNELTMRKLADKIDVKAPALYWHFKNKEVLIDHLAEAILKEEFGQLSVCKVSDPWREWLIHVCKRLRFAILKYRDGARVVAGAHLFPAITYLKIFETCLLSLTSAGIELSKARLIVTTCINFVMGTLIEEQSSPGSEELANSINMELLKDFPLVCLSIEELNEDSWYNEKDFEAALWLILGQA